MNFLIFDKEFQSSNLIGTILVDFRHVTLITSQNTLETIPSLSPTFLSVKQVDITNASDVIHSLSKHEHDPYDAIIMFDVSAYSNFLNVLQTMKRFRRQPPHLFIFFVDHKYEADQNIVKLLKDVSTVLSWTIVLCREINSATPEKYTVKLYSNEEQQQSIASKALLHFICDEIKSKKYDKKVISIY